MKLCSDSVLTWDVEVVSVDKDYKSGVLININSPVTYGVNQPYVTVIVATGINIL